MSRQYFSWGYVDWLETGMSLANIGISHIRPRTTQAIHMHHENEQLLYVLKGQGLYTCNDKIYELKQGDYLYFPFNARHATENQSDRELVDLVISITKKSYATNYWNLSTARYIEYENDLIAAVDALNLENNAPRKIDFQIIAYQTDEIVFSTYEIKQPFSMRTIQDVPRHYFKEYEIACEGEVYGYILVDLSKIMEEYENRIAASTEQSLEKFFQELSRGLGSFCQFNQWQRCLYRESSSLTLEQDIRHIQKDLQVEKQVSRNLKINQHFLFNTLNLMAEMALGDNNIKLYDSILLLADLFRYSSNNIGQFGSLEAELNYLESYLKLQKLRYGDGLYFSIKVDPEAKEAEVPVNFLQPLVENAFSHGFINYNQQKHIEIEIKSYKHWLKITIANNGILPDMSTLQQMKKEMKRDNNHGLAMIYQKLKFHYRDEFTMSFKTESKQFEVAIEIPKAVSSC